MASHRVDAIFSRVEPDTENGNAWATATGLWVHRWLAESVRQTTGDASVQLCEVDEIRDRLVRQRAAISKRGARSLCR